MLGGTFGRYFLASGAAGELFPILAIAIFLGVDSSLAAILSIAAIAVIGLVLASAPTGVAGRAAAPAWSPKERTPPARPRSGGRSCCSSRCSCWPASSGSTSSSAPSWPASCCGTGRRASAHAFEAKLDAIGYGFFIPVFFVVAGMAVDLGSILEAPARVVCVPRAPAAGPRSCRCCSSTADALAFRRRSQLMFCTATTLPLDRGADPDRAGERDDAAGERRRTGRRRRAVRAPVPLGRRAPGPCRGTGAGRGEHARLHLTISMTPEPTRYGRVHGHPGPRLADRSRTAGDLGQRARGPRRPRRRPDAGQPDVLVGELPDAGRTPGRRGRRPAVDRGVRGRVPGRPAPHVRHRRHGRVGGGRCVVRRAGAGDRGLHRDDGHLGPRAAAAQRRGDVPRPGSRTPTGSSRSS